MCTMCMISPGGKVVGLFSSYIDPVARAVDKEISMEMMLKGSSKSVGFIYFIKIYQVL